MSEHHLYKWNIKAKKMMLSKTNRLFMVSAQGLLLLRNGGTQLSVDWKAVVQEPPSLRKPQASPAPLGVTEEHFSAQHSIAYRVPDLTVSMSMGVLTMSQCDDVKPARGRPAGTL